MLGEHERHRQRREHDRERHAVQLRPGVADEPAARERTDRRVARCHHEGDDPERLATVADDHGCQRERRRSTRICEPEARRGHRDAAPQLEGERQHEEQHVKDREPRELGAPLRRVVTTREPSAIQQERTCQRGGIERAPATDERDRDDAEIEHHEVRAQRIAAAVARRQRDRRDEATDQREDRDGLRVVTDRDRTSSDRHADQRRERELARDQLVRRERDKRRDVQHAEPGPEEALRERPHVRAMGAVPRGQQREPGAGAEPEPRLGPEPALVDRELDEQRCADHERGCAEPGDPSRPGAELPRAPAIDALWWSAWRRQDDRRNDVARRVDGRRWRHVMLDHGEPSRQRGDLECGA